MIFVNNESNSELFITEELLDQLLSIGHLTVCKIGSVILEIYSSNFLNVISEILNILIIWLGFIPKNLPNHKHDFLHALMFRHIPLVDIVSGLTVLLGHKHFITGLKLSWLLRLNPFNCFLAFQ